MPFPFVFFFWDTYDSNVGVFNIAPEVRLSSVLFILLFSFLLASLISIILSSHSLMLSYILVTLKLVLSRVFLISVIALFIID